MVFSKLQKLTFISKMYDFTILESQKDERFWTKIMTCWPQWKVRPTIIYQNCMNFMELIWIDILCPISCHKGKENHILCKKMQHKRIMYHKKCKYKDVRKMYITSMYLKSTTVHIWNVDIFLQIGIVFFYHHG